MLNAHILRFMYMTCYIIVTCTMYIVSRVAAVPVEHKTNGDVFSFIFFYLIKQHNV